MDRERYTQEDPDILWELCDILDEKKGRTGCFATDYTLSHLVVGTGRGEIDSILVYGCTQYDIDTVVIDIFLALNDHDKLTRIQLFPRYYLEFEHLANLYGGGMCEDAVIHFSHNTNGERYSRRLDPVWFELMKYERWYHVRLDGTPIKWETLRKAWARRHYNELFDDEDDFYCKDKYHFHDNDYDTDALLYDAYEGDMDAWNSR